VLPIELLTQIRAIEPSVDREAAFLPCSVWLRDGAIHERVYLIDAEHYARTWGLVPRRNIVVEEALIRVAEYAERLPVRPANQLYAAGESGMGYFRFVLEFHGGTAQAYVTGNAVDFVPYPAEYHAMDVVRALPHASGEAGSYLEGLSYMWCPVAGLSNAVPHLRPRAPWWKFWSRLAAT
jgi:hypothetical protein